MGILKNVLGKIRAGGTLLRFGSIADGQYLKRDGSRVVGATPAGSGDMEAATYDPTSVEGDVFDMGNMAEAANAKVMTAAERTRLAALDEAIASQGEAEAGTDNSKRMTPLRVAQAIAHLGGGGGLQNDFDHDGAPTVDDDTGEGYAPGSVIIDTTADPHEAYRCADATEGAAVWLKTTLTADELAAVALSGDSDDLTEGSTKLLMTTAERAAVASAVQPGDLGSLAPLSSVGTDEIDDAAVTLAKMANLSGAGLIGRADAGVPQELSPASVRTLLNVGDGANMVFSTDVVDEDNMASDSATKVPTQQSVAAFVRSVLPQPTFDYAALDQYTGSLAGYWKFEDGLASIDRAWTWQDDNGITYDTGVSGQGALLAQSNVDALRIDLPMVSSQPSSLAMAIRVKFTSLPSTSGTMWIAGAFGSNASYMALSLAVYNSGGNCKFQLYSNWDTWVGFLGTTTLATDTWYDVVVVADGSYLRLYVNGTEEGTPAALSNSIGAITGWVIGRWRTSSGYEAVSSRYLDGMVDEMGIWEVSFADGTARDAFASNLYNSGTGRYMVAAGGEANPDVVSQEEAEAGVATTERIWTAERVAQAIAALAAGGDGEASGWYEVPDADYTATPASSTTITLDTVVMPITIAVGMGVRYQFANTGSTWYYGRVAAITPTLLTIGGFWLSGASQGDITELQIGPDKIECMSVAKDGTYAASTVEEPGTRWAWAGRNAYVVGAVAAHRTVDSTSQPVLNVQNFAGQTLFSSNMTMSGAANTPVATTFSVNQSRVAVTAGTVVSIIVITAAGTGDCAGLWAAFYVCKE